MKRTLKKIILPILLIAFVGIQFIPTNRNQSDEILPSDITKVFEVPDNILQLLQNSCYDCHSNNTNYPWYNKIQPISWMLENHIQEGKEEVNFSRFGDYSTRKKKSKFKSIISQLKDGEMPLWSYTLIHRSAKLSEEERKMLVDWMQAQREAL